MYPLALSAFLVNSVADGVFCRLRLLHLHPGFGLDLPTARGGGPPGRDAQPVQLVLQREQASR